MLQMVPRFLGLLSLLWEAVKAYLRFLKTQHIQKEKWCKACWSTRHRQEEVESIMSNLLIYFCRLESKTWVRTTVLIGQLRTQIVRASTSHMPMVVEAPNRCSELTVCNAVLLVQVLCTHRHGVAEWKLLHLPMQQVGVSPSATLRPERNTWLLRAGLVLQCRGAGMFHHPLPISPHQWVGSWLGVGIGITG